MFNLDRKIGAGSGVVPAFFLSRVCGNGYSVATASTPAGGGGRRFTGCQSDWCHPSGNIFSPFGERALKFTCPLCRVAVLIALAPPTCLVSGLPGYDHDIAKGYRQSFCFFSREALGLLLIAPFPHRSGSRAARLRPRADDCGRQARQRPRPGAVGEGRDFLAKVKGYSLATPF